MRLPGKTEVPVPVPLYPPQISDYLESKHSLHSQRPETKNLSQCISCMPYKYKQIMVKWRDLPFR